MIQINDILIINFKNWLYSLLLNENSFKIYAYYRKQRADAVTLSDYFILYDVLEITINSFQSYRQTLHNVDLHCG